MKKWIAIFTFSVCFTVAASLLNFEEAAEKQLIRTKSGEPIIADHVSQSDRFVFYRYNGKSGMFMNEDVAFVGPITVDERTPLVLIFDRWRDQAIDLAGWSINGRKWLDSRFLLFLASLFCFSALTQLFQFSIRWIRTKENDTTEKGRPLGSTDGDWLNDKEVMENSDLREIALFFLELHKVQNGLGADAPAHFRMTGQSSSGEMTIFELCAQTSREWLNRRMSIGPIGEETGSKSKCYYVIYDTHMVIKLPPTDVMDMDTYVRAIQKDERIASQLTPVKCIVPMVSVVLKKVTPLPFPLNQNQEELEKGYIRLVERKPDYQAYLKIGNRFAFFMELTNNFFLGRVINELHLSKERIGDEIREIPDVMWDQQAFTNRYGLASFPVFNRLQTLYKECESTVHSIVRMDGRQAKIQTFQIKHWFLSKIAGEKLQWVARGGDEQLIERVEEGFSEIFKSNQQIVDDVLQLLKSRLAERAFIGNREAIENLASNTIELLWRLEEKQLVLRDLKPDNLFLDANPDHYPDVLKDPDRFSIGVIDVETAVSLKPNKDGQIEQPLIGGTPLYATPLHLFNNETLSSSFAPLKNAFFYQDWYAMVAIVFKEITGKNLFVRAAKSFPAALKRLKKSKSKPIPDDKTIHEICNGFWSAALWDMKKALAGHANVLYQLVLRLPEEMAPRVETELKRERACLKRAIQKHVSLSPLLKSEKNRTFLVEASCETIKKQVARWETPESLSEQNRLIAPEMVSFLNTLNRMKEGEKQKAVSLATLSQENRQISAHALLEAMFQIIYIELYKSRWNKHKAPTATPEPVEEDDENRSLVTTILTDS
jgi:serine/threonine protein kinase